MNGIDKLRKMVNCFDYCRESFNERFSVKELSSIFDAQTKSDWCYLPDEWTERQVLDALKGIVPQWDEEGNPVYK